MTTDPADRCPHCGAAPFDYAATFSNRDRKYYVCAVCYRNVYRADNGRLDKDEEADTATPRP